eukprot:TRINITY_DN4316_c0_g1_i1.p1 TRINITY_DN4316_c0_g1~~TRINITY_DN4316_c0_g1_i1.p1  ORF type:complete len:217 (+),score=4.75 TRINITY_DN4316_c0_g1_i1:115-765(+)
MNKPHPPGKKKGKRSKRGIAGLPSAKQSKTPRTSLCVIFARTGQCRFGSKCRFKHDKSKLALCGRFLLGQCNGNCHLSHQVVDGNQPHCNYFQSNKCTKKKCPFAHVKVAADATFCPDFLAGYCDAGFDCPFRHVAPCIPFLISGNCKFQYCFCFASDHCCKLRANVFAPKRRLQSARRNRHDASRYARWNCRAESKDDRRLCYTRHCSLEVFDRV